MARAHRMVAEFADILRDLRDLRGWTQFELGRESGLSEASISRYESGQRHPNAESMRKIAGAFGVYFVVGARGISVEADS